ncbi:helix-turn-helix domain-containing protein [Alkalicoccus daliensis]|uniref:Helix-turn-helix domain-containing protein n=1 Tax=Alkalicoccus daliensis TaxID=745820 RepID=A0A1G9ZKS8_9BACI|nr:helix-turn-helix transcriptional regulator [Alkalicoccus daliensis]SDN21894.1 Helix-turn-helix domain-containing protein [Alkalicoccus daliensis]
MIGKNIARLRKKKGITLTELAEKANISKSNLSNIEREINQNPSIKVLEKLAEVLETDLITILDLKAENEIQKEYETILQRISSLNLTEVELKEYEKVLEFIEWQKKSVKG